VSTVDVSPDHASRERNNDLDLLAQPTWECLVTPLGNKQIKSILFVCIENSSRSIMAEAFARRLGLDATSAGTFPSTKVNPLVVQVMQEVGLDVSQGRPKGLSEDAVDKADLVVLTDSTLEDSFPKALRKKMKNKIVRWSVSDPRYEPIEGIRMIRDEIERKVLELGKNAGA
jgi:protein-tyrosine-phosphatase